MRNVNLYDVKVMDGYILRFVMVHQLNEYVLELNCLFSQLSEFDFDVTDMYVYYAYQKLFMAKVERLRSLIRFLERLKLVSRGNAKRMLDELEDMIRLVI